MNMRTYKSYWQGSSWVVSMPSQIAQICGLDEGSNIQLEIHENEIVVTPPKNGEVRYKRPKKVEENKYIVPLRVIGAEGVTGKKKYLYRQLGFTIPKEFSDRFADKEFEINLQEKRDDFFKVIYTVVE